MSAKTDKARSPRQLVVADSHEFLELYRGDKDLRMGMEFVKLRPELEFSSFAPSAASPNDRERFGITRVADGPVPTLPERFDLQLIDSIGMRFRRAESGGIVSVMPRYGRALRDLRPDVLFENPYSWLTPRSYQSYFASRRLGFPVIYYDPGDDIAVNWRQGVLAPLETPVVNHASRIITYNEAGRRRFIEKYGYPAERIRVIPKPVDVAQCTFSGSVTSMREALSGGVQDAILVVYVGRLTKYKGSRVLREVALRASNEPAMSALRFVFVGGALATDENEDDYRLPNTHVTGMVPHEEIPRYLAASDVVVIPDLTRPGGFSTAAAEAMAAGSTIIAGVGARTDFLPLYDGVNALTVGPSDPDAILAALRRLVENPGLGQQLGVTVGEYARSNMDYPRVAQQYLDIADEVISESAAVRQTSRKGE